MSAAKRFALSLGILTALAASLSVPALDPSKALTQYGHEVWLMEQGLPQNSALAVLQTRDGYIWVGTQEGLARFDGVRFTVFDKANTPALGTNIVNALCEGPDGSLWIGTDGGGVVRFKDGAFTALTTRDGLSMNRIACLRVDRSGALWVGTEGEGIDKIEQGRVTVYQKAQGYPSGVAWAIAEDRAGALWFGTGKGLVKLEAGRFTTYTVKDGLCNDVVTSLAEDAQGRLWVGTYDGLNCLNDGRWERYTKADGLAHSNVLSLYPDGRGCLWVGTYGGVSRLKDGRFESYTTREGLSNDSVWSLAGDAEGSLWMGTLGGLDRFRDTKFTVVGVPEGLHSDVVVSVLQARDGSLWVGTEGGGATRFSAGRVRTFRAADGLGSDVVFALAEDDAGAIWIGTDIGTLCSVEGDRVRKISLAGAELKDTSISAILPWPDGGVYLGTSAGLVRWRDGKATRWREKDGLSSSVINCLLRGRDGALWIGTDGGGVCRFQGGRFAAFTRKVGLADDVVLSLHEDAEGALWVGTNSGLTRMKDGQASSLTTQQGLFDDKVFLILEDGRGNFWMTCNKGVFTAPQKSLADCARRKTPRVSCTVYGKADGLRTSECNGATQPVGWRGGDGKLYFATMRGVGVMDPAAIRLNTTPPPVVIEEILVDGGELSPHRPGVLKPGNHRIEFRYTALSLIAPEKTLFKCKLEGLEAEWVDAGNRREAFYTGIPPGSYTFRVVACNNDGFWNEAGASYAFRLEPRFYQARWFYVLIAVGFVLLGASVQRFRVMRLKARELELLGLVEAQTAQLASANEALSQRGQELEKANAALKERGEQLEFMNEELKRLTTLDPLTGIFNRRYFDEIYEVEWRRAKRSGYLLSLIMVDIDSFKPFNDRYGHQAGDECLRQVARALSDSLHRAGDLVARYGGEEFVVILPAHDVRSSVELARRLRVKVESLGIPTEVSEASKVLTISLGVATGLPREGGAPEALLNAADGALYTAKQEGRNRVVAAAPVDQEEPPPEERG